MIKFFLTTFFIISNLFAQYLLVPMDLTQTNHLKAYGLAYFVLKKDINVEWLLNYRGGSFLFSDSEMFRKELQLRGIRFEQLDATTVSQIYAQIEENNMEKVLLAKAPKIADYSPPGFQPWDDAVTLAMVYSEIEYDQIYDTDVLQNKLEKYDWLHLHHEDFTGQYGKFWGSFRNQTWYIKQQLESEELASSLGYAKVSALKRDVAVNIRDYVDMGGFLFAMCSATDALDIALAAQKTDICEAVFDGDPIAADYFNKLNFDVTFAFKNFNIILR